MRRLQRSHLSYSTDLNSRTRHLLHLLHPLSISILALKSSTFSVQEPMKLFPYLRHPTKALSLSFPLPQLGYTTCNAPPFCSPIAKPALTCLSRNSARFISLVTALPKNSQTTC